MVRPLADLEKEAILQAIIETGSLTKAAIALGIGRVTIYRKFKRYGIELKISQIRTELRRQQNLQFVPKR